ncbi:MAG: cellulase family glycosylhydrolase [Victivallales bacterium]|nr:cellulase family glycosylhydrolase [Victivallales bacterium]
MNINKRQISKPQKISNLNICNKFGTKFAFVLIFALFCFSLNAEYKNEKLLYANDFNSIESLSDWGKHPQKYYRPHAGNDNSGALYFRIDKKQKQPADQLISISLNNKNIYGLIQIEAVLRGKDIVRGAETYYGPKVMLVYRKNGKTYYPDIPYRFGTYDWVKIRRVVKIPKNSENMILVLGMQGISGELWIDNVTIYNCVEDQSLKNVPPPVNPEADKIPRGNFKGTEYRGVMSGSDLSPEAFKTLSEWNVNLVRYQLRPGLNIKPKADISTPERYLAWIDAEIKRLDELMPLFQKHGIKVVIDLHVGPGTKMSQVLSNVLVDGETNLDTLDATWRKLAAHYKGNPNIYGYDLLNEPKTDNYMKGVANPWQLISERLVKVIRAIDSDTPIITEPNFRFAKPIADKNIIYSPHFYSPISYTHQGVMSRQVKWSYPGYIDGVYWDKNQLRVSLRSVIEFQRRTQCRIYLGEFGVANWAAGGDQYLKDAIELFEEYGWDWTYHAFREWPPWSLEHEGIEFHKTVPSSDNARKRVVLEAFTKNKRNQ